MYHILRRKDSVSDEQLQRFSMLDAATVHEAADRLGAMDSCIKPLAQGMKLCGRALTVKTHQGDNLMIHLALPMAGPGDVLVVDTGPCIEGAHIGDLMTAQAKKNGIAGFVMNGGVRDSAMIRKNGLPVFAPSVSMKGLMKDSAGFINHPISCGGVAVNPGDLVIADDDGVVVVPFERAAEVYEKAMARFEKEQKALARIEAGETMYDIMDFAVIKEKLGITEEL